MKWKHIYKKETFKISALKHVLRLLHKHYYIQCLHSLSLYNCINRTITLLKNVQMTETHSSQFFSSFFLFGLQTPLHKEGNILLLMINSKIDGNLYFWAATVLNWKLKESRLGNLWHSICSGSLYWTLLKMF